MNCIEFVIFYDLECTTEMAQSYRIIDHGLKRVALYEP